MGGAYTRRIVEKPAAPTYPVAYYVTIDNANRARPPYTGLRKVIQKPRFLAAGIALPPFDEQQRIAVYLKERTAKIDALIAESERFIELALERRSALISAAVTGQIDVRVGHNVNP